MTNLLLEIFLNYHFLPSAMGSGLQVLDLPGLVDRLNPKLREGAIHIKLSAPTGVQPVNDPFLYPEGDEQNRQVLSCGKYTLHQPPKMAISRPLNPSGRHDRLFVHGGALAPLWQPRRFDPGRRRCSGW